MTHFANLQRVNVESAFDGAAVFASLRRIFARSQTDTAPRVTDEAILNAIAHLNDQQLDDIGMCRKLRRSTWRSSARGMEPTIVCEFDYFRINI